MVDILKNLTKKLELKRRFLGIVLAWYIVTSLFTALPMYFNKVHLVEGDIAGNNIVSPSDIQFETAKNKEDTARLREARFASVQPVYDVDLNALSDSKSRINNLFSHIRELKSLPSTADRREQIITRDMTYNLSRSAIRKMERQPPSVLVLMEDISIRIVENLMQKGIEDKDSVDLKEQVKNSIPKTTYKVILTSIILQSLENNMTFSEEKTEEARARAAAEIKPLYTQYRKGQPILFKGDAVTVESIEIMKKVGVYRNSIDFLRLIAVLLINLFLTAFVLLAGIHVRFDNLNLIIVLEIILLFMTRLVLPYSVAFVPIIFVAMMLALFMTRFGLGSVALFKMVLLATIMTHNDLRFFIFLFFTAEFTAYLSNKIRSRTDIMLYGLYSGLSSIGVYLTLIMLNKQSFSLTQTPIEVGYILLGGLIASILVQGISPYFEYVFNLLTPVRLLDLADPSHPLLKRLMVEAPGTYHHSLMVANLSEPAVDALGGSGLIARVGAYYHDVGKLVRPYFFIENQTDTNPHDRIGSQLSAKIILSHPKEGELIARQYGMPDKIIDIIKQHHGTGIISFFYRQMLLQEKEADVNEDDFNYPGPLPQSMEAVVVMLADSCEAAIRSLDKPTPVKVENLIDRIIKERLDSGQLNECGLTFKDLSIVSKSFMKTLEGMFHNRIKYDNDPDVADKKEKNPKKDDDKKSDKSKQNLPKKD